LENSDVRVLLHYTALNSVIVFLFIKVKSDLLYWK